MIYTSVEVSSSSSSSLVGLYFVYMYFVCTGFKTNTCASELTYPFRFWAIMCLFSCTRNRIMTVIHLFISPSLSRPLSIIIRLWIREPNFLCFTFGFPCESHATWLHYSSQCSMYIRYCETSYFWCEFISPLLSFRSEFYSQKISHSVLVLVKKSALLFFSSLSVVKYDVSVKYDVLLYSVMNILLFFLCKSIS